MSRTLSLGLFAAASAALLVFAACGGSDEDPAATGGSGGTAKGGSAGVAGTAGGAQGGAAGSQAGGGGEAGSAAGGGGSAGSTQGTSCANAIPLKAATETAGSLYPPGAVVYYSAEFKANEWTVIYTDANPDDDQNKIDTVVTVEDENGKMLAEMDDSMPRASTDTEMFYHPPTDQKVCLKVQEWSTWNGDAPAQKSKANSAFKIVYGALDGTKAPYTHDTEPNNDTATATVENLYASTSSTSHFAFLYGTLDPDTDVDYYSFTQPTGNGQLELYIGPKGTNGWGYTTNPGVLDVVDDQGNVLSRLDASKGANHLVMPLAEGTKAFLKVPRPAGAALGSNDAYFFKQVMFESYYELEKETTTGTNDTIATAEQLVEYVPETPNPDVKAYYVLGHLDPAADVDYFKFQGLDAKKLNVECSAARAGSGLQSVTFEYLGPLDADAGTATSIQSETETLDADVVWSEYPNPKPSNTAPDINAGDYLLKVSATGQDATVKGNYYVCTLIVIGAYTP